MGTKPVRGVYNRRAQRFTWSHIFFRIDSSPVLNVSGAFVAIVAIILRSAAALEHSGVKADPLPVCTGAEKTGK